MTPELIAELAIETQHELDADSERPVANSQGKLMQSTALLDSAYAGDISNAAEAVIMRAFRDNRLEEADIFGRRFRLNIMDVADACKTSKPKE